MSDRCSAGSAALDHGSPELGFDTRSSVSRILGDEESCGSGSPASPSTTTYETVAENIDGTPTAHGNACSAHGGPTEGGTVPPLISSAAASPAKTSALPDTRRTHTAANDPASSSSSPAAQTSLFQPEGRSSSRTFPDYFPARADEISPIVLATLAELGFHDLAWRMLDSRYFGVPQRRRRVFLVGRRASGRRAFRYFEPEGGGGDSAAGGEAGAGVAGTPAAALGSAQAGTTNGGRTSDGYQSCEDAHGLAISNAPRCRRSRCRWLRCSGHAYVWFASRQQHARTQARGRHQHRHRVRLSTASFDQRQPVRRNQHGDSSQRLRAQLERRQVRGRAREQRVTAAGSAVSPRSSASASKACPDDWTRVPGHRTGQPQVRRT